LAPDRSKRARAARDQAKRWARRRKLRELDGELARLEALHHRFEDLLARHGSRIRPGSDLEQALLLATQLRYVRNEKAPLPEVHDDAEDNMWRRAGWMRILIPKLLAAESHADFSELVPHLRLLVEGEIAQSVPGPRDEPSDKLFELTIALALLPAARNLRLDTGSAGPANLDILCDFEGERWGIACKALYTTDPRRYRDVIRNGARQIERSEATRGFVCISLRNILDQRLLLPRVAGNLQGMPSSAMHAILDDEQARIQRDLIEPVSRDIAKDFASRPGLEKGVVHVLGGC
jgi:hypothetical protein